MDLESRKSKSIFGVAMAFILLGAILFTVGIVAWIVNCYAQNAVISSPSIKGMGGLVILALGYILLELEMIRRK